MPSQGTSTFDLFALRFHCAAPEPVHFPPGETANLFRGQFGKILHRARSRDCTLDSSHPFARPEFPVDCTIRRGRLCCGYVIWMAPRCRNFTSA